MRRPLRLPSWYPSASLGAEHRCSLGPPAVSEPPSRNGGDEVIPSHLSCQHFSGQRTTGSRARTECQRVACAEAGANLKAKMHVVDSGEHAAGQLLACRRRGGRQLSLADGVRLGIARTSLSRDVSELAWATGPRSIDRPCCFPFETCTGQHGTQTTSPMPGLWTPSDPTCQ